MICKERESQCVSMSCVHQRTPIQEIQSAFDRVTASNIKYRFVIDMSSLQ